MRHIRLEQDIVEDIFLGTMKRGKLKIMWIVSQCRCPVDRNLCQPTS